MRDLTISEQHLKQLQKDCEMLSVDLSRLKWSSTRDGRFMVQHDKPRVDISSFGVELPEGLAVSGSSLKVQVYGHWMARAIQIAERKALRYASTRTDLDPYSLIARPIDDRELADFREAQRRMRRIEDLQQQLVQARAAKARKEATRQELADMKARYGVTPDKAAPVQDSPVEEPTLAGTAGVPRGPGRKTKQQPLFTLEGHDHVSQ